MKARVDARSDCCVRWRVDGRLSNVQGRLESSVFIMIYAGGYML